MPNYLLRPEGSQGGTFWSAAALLERCEEDTDVRQTVLQLHEAFLWHNSNFITLHDVAFNIVQRVNVLRHKDSGNVVLARSGGDPDILIKVQKASGSWEALWHLVRHTTGSTISGPALAFLWPDSKLPPYERGDKPLLTLQSLAVRSISSLSQAGENSQIRFLEMGAADLSWTMPGLRKTAKTFILTAEDTCTVESS